MKTYKLAVVGATGAVGAQMLDVLASRGFPVGELLPLASAASEDRTVTFKGATLPVRVLDEQSFAGVEIALFSAGAAVSERFAPIAAAAGAMVIDNTSAFRLAPDVPLVVPEVNAEAALNAPRRIVANPNCSTVQMVVALAPLRRAAGIKRIVVSTYQAVSGAGLAAIAELREQSAAWAARRPLPAPSVFSHPIVGECLPQIGDINEEGDSVEELKMIDETRKIFADPELRISATAVRVPVAASHSEAVNVELERPLSADDARALLKEAAGVSLVDEPRAQRYPLAREATGKDPVYVGRIRRDPSLENGLSMWVVADNLRKGAALNAVQIAEFLMDRDALISLFPPIQAKDLQL